MPRPPSFRPTWLMLGVAAATLLASIAVIAWLPIERIHSIMIYSVGRERLLDYSVFDRAIQYDKDNIAPNTYKIAIVGGSTSRSMIWSEEYAQQALEPLVGLPVRYINLTSKGQSVVTSWALARRIACSGADLVLFGTNLNRWAKRLDAVEPDAWFEPTAPEITSFLQAAPYAERQVVTASIAPVSKGLRFNAYILYLSAKHIAQDIIYGRGPGAYADSEMNLVAWHRVRNWQRMPERLKEGLRQATIRHTSSPPEFYEWNWKALDEVARSVHACGASFALLQSPVNPLLTIKGRYAEAQRQHVLSADEFARRTGTDVIDPNLSLGYRVEDLRDYGHLRTADAVQRTTVAIAGEIAGIIRRRDIRPRNAPQ